MRSPAATGPAAETDVGNDQDIGIHRPRDVDGQVLGEAPVHQQTPLVIDRREHPGCRYACPHGDGQVALVQQDGASRLQIGGHRPERRRETIEIGAVAERQRQLAQGLLQFLALDESLGQKNLPVLQAQRQSHQEIPIILLAPERQIATRRRIAERLLPIDRAHRQIDVVRAHPARVQTTHDGAHAGAGNAIDGNSQLFEDLEDADVRHAARPAA